MKKQLGKMIFDQLVDIKDDYLDLKEEQTIPIYGMDGKLDSLELVNLIVNLEEAVYANFGINVTLADEKAFSQKSSPFLTVHSLSEYIKTLLAAVSDE